MIEAQMKTDMLVQNLIPGGRESQPAVVDVCGVIALAGKCETKCGVLARLHFQSDFAAA